ncbi:MAG: histidine phosphatase family protein [Nitrospinota bacterium]
MSLTLFFVRHGETFANSINIVQGRFDSKLTQKGILHSKSIADKLSNISIDHIFTSSSQRTINSAGIIQNRKKLSANILKQSELLLEIDFGLFSKLPKTVLLPIVQYYKKFDTLPYPKGESGHDLTIRVTNFLDLLLKKYSPNSNILIITHYGVLDTLRTILKLNLFDSSKIFQLNFEQSILHDYRLF